MTIIKKYLTDFRCFLSVTISSLYPKVSPYISMSQQKWQTFQKTIKAHPRVQSVLAFLHQNIRFLPWLTKNVRYIAVLCSVFILGIAWFWPQTPSVPKRTFKDQALSVEAAPVYVGPLRKEMSVVGSLRAHQRVVLHSETQGTVEKILVQPGDHVKKDQILIELEHKKLDAQRQEAEAKVAQARTVHEKEAYLFQKNAGKKISYTEALQTMKVAEAQLELVTQDLRRTKITAPFGGYTSLHDISVGAFITPSVDLLTIIDMQKVWVDFRVPEQHVSTLEIGQNVEVTIDQQSDTLYTATIRAIDPFVDPVTHSTQVRAELNHVDATLRPGVFARVTVPLHEIPQAIMVPENAVEREGTEEYVMRTSEGVALKTLVITGLRKEGMVEVIDGLSKDDVIITAGHQRVRDGQKVRILQDKQPAATTTPQS